MSKSSKSGSAYRVANRQCHARISFLYQAASFMTTIPAFGEEMKSASKAKASIVNAKSQICNRAVPGHKHQAVIESASDFGLSQYYSSHIHNIARKGQIKLARDFKRSICKGCSTVLVLGTTSDQRIDNSSLHGKKSWADVLVITCRQCGLKKQIPLETKCRRRKQRQKSESAPAIDAALKEVRRHDGGAMT